MSSGGVCDGLGDKGAPPKHVSNWEDSKKDSSLEHIGPESF